MHLVTLATCNLNQWALDFVGNLERVEESIRAAKAAGARLRTGPELEITGYGCEDHFLEMDTFEHAWESIAELLQTDLTDDILVDVGMPVYHNSARYNCRVFLLNRRVVFIRPKMSLAADCNYRESRWFVEWQKPRVLEEYHLPPAIRELTGDDCVPIGDGVVEALDSLVGCEMCEELWTPRPSSGDLALEGVEIILNGSGSHHNLRKLSARLDLIRSATTTAGGVYLYANQQGCDGGRLYYDGCALAVLNGKVIGQGSQFSLRDVEMVTVNVDLDEVRAKRSAPSTWQLASKTPQRPRVKADILLANVDTYVCPTAAFEPFVCGVEEEINNGPAAWLWDYLRRSGMKGFFLPLSGGIDSSSTATIVGSMCHMVCAEAAEGNEQVIKDARRIMDKGDDWIPTDPKELANAILHTCYMGSSNSSQATRKRAADLAEEIGSFHFSINIDSVCAAIIAIFVAVASLTPKFKVHGGGWAENVALQNIQARVRMIFAYLFAQLMMWWRGRQGGVLVLGSANVDEALMGYFTKYDCSAADINPIGGVSKRDLRRYIKWASQNLPYPSLEGILGAPPTAELEPITEDYTQTDEADLGMTYDELSVFGRLRKIRNFGPVSCFNYLVRTRDQPAKEVAEKVKLFFKSYSRNRHKMTTLTPSYHAEAYSPDDNRHDLRQFLYPQWDRQFARIDALVAEYEAHEARMSASEKDKSGAKKREYEADENGPEPPKAKRQRKE